MIKVIGFENGLELVQFLEYLSTGTQLPACIILDMEMPVWDGLRALRAIKENAKYSAIPVYMLSNKSNDRDRAPAMNMGCMDYMTKPYGQHDLQNACEEFVSCNTHPLQYKGRYQVKNS